MSFTILCDYSGQVVHSSHTSSAELLEIRVHLVRLTCQPWECTHRSVRSTRCRTSYSRCIIYVATD